ncbi:MAG: flagellar hook-associated protein FlgL [Colwellia sp.]
MRISTEQFYQQSSSQMSNKSSSVNEQMEHISSGKRILTAKDDAILYGTLAGYNESLSNIDKYKRNIIQAESHNKLQDVVFADAGNNLNTIKDNMLQAHNGAMSDEDIDAIVIEARSALDQLLDLSNSKDENGDYIFSGYKVELKPFRQQPDGSVSYSGDSGVRELQIAKNINIATSQAGDASFMNIPNAIGDFTATYPTAPINSSGMSLSSANVSDRNTYNTSATPHDYTFTFDATTADLTVTDSLGGTTLFPVASYSGGQTISFDGIDVSLSGNPLPGESFTMNEQEDVTLFENINNAISWLERGSVSFDQEQYEVDFNTILDQLNVSLSHITSRRVESGIRLQVLESQESRHLDTALSQTSGRSAIEDLDFTKAITEFEQAQVALQTSQQTFSATQGLSLFNYI